MASSETRDPLAREAAALRLSARVSLGMAVLAVVWGLVAESQIILFDGLYAGIGFLLSRLGMRAAALVEAGPTPRYPFGREALAPLVVGIQAFVLLGTFGYAAVDAVSVILAGGGDTALWSALVYSVITLVLVLVVRAMLVRRQEGSDLVAAEVAQWHASALLGVAMVIGFALAVVLKFTPLADLAPFVDPALVLLAGVLILPTPLGMLRSAYRELLEGRPSRSVTEPIHAAVDRLRAAEGLPEPELRIGKLGRKVYIELDWVVPEADGWTVADADRIRRALIQDLAQPGQLLWLNVELHTNPYWDVK